MMVSNFIRIMWAPGSVEKCLGAVPSEHHVASISEPGLDFDIASEQLPLHNL